VKIDVIIADEARFLVQPTIYELRVYTSGGISNGRIKY